MIKIILDANTYGGVSRGGVATDISYELSIPIGTDPTDAESKLRAELTPESLQETIKQFVSRFLRDGELMTLDEFTETHGSLTGEQIPWLVIKPDGQKAMEDPSSKPTLAMVTHDGNDGTYDDEENWEQDLIEKMTETKGWMLMRAYEGTEWKWMKTGNLGTWGYAE